MNVLSFINTYTGAFALCAFLIVTGCVCAVRYRLFSPKALTGYARSALSRRGGCGISPLSSLTVALSGTLGVGNIVGVAVALSLGGAGAVFWMMVSAFFGMFCKFAEAYLAVKTRIRRGDKYAGGAPYYITAVFGKRAAGILYAVICLLFSLTVGPVIQVNSASSALYGTFGVPRAVTGIVFALLCAGVVFGGIKRVSSFTDGAMPVFCALYLGICIIAISMRLDGVWDACVRIVTEAFDFKSVSGGIAGFFLSGKIRHGMAKGVLSHEAGCGTAAFSHAASDTTAAHGQGFIGSLEVFADTVIFGGLTALVILLAPNSAAGDAYNGTMLTINAFSCYFGGASGYIITGFIVFFAFAALICQAYYGCEAAEYIVPGEKTRRAYLVLYCACAAAGAVIAPVVMWELSDLCCLLLITVNCTAMIKGIKKT